MMLVRRKVTLQEAVNEISGIARTADTLRSAAHKSPTFPAVAGWTGRSKVYYLDELERWNTERRLARRPSGTPCAYRDCGRGHYSRGYCRWHSILVSRGEALTPITRNDRAPYATRLQSKIDENGPRPTCRPELGPCWLWLGGKTKGGYGSASHSDGKVTCAHRVVYTFLIGDIPDGLTLDHLCRVRACVNPYHLEPVTATVNKRRGRGGIATKQRHRRVTHCPAGHPYTDDNTGYAVKGKYRTRVCITCKRASGR